MHKPTKCEVRRSYENGIWMRYRSSPHQTQLHAKIHKLQVRQLHAKIHKLQVRYYMLKYINCRYKPHFDHWFGPWMINGVSESPQYCIFLTEMWHWKSSSYKTYLHPNTCFFYFVYLPWISKDLSNTFYFLAWQPATWSGIHDGARSRSSTKICCCWEWWVEILKKVIVYVEITCWNSH